MLRRDVLLTGLGATFAAPHAATGAPAAAPPAVLELFTSQGCSSCPPADALLGQLARQPGIIALAWHVDYWNGLGWRDPYSTATATQRQRRYAAALREDVYTPALVVNGARMVVGSDGGAIHAAIGAAGGFAVPVALRRDGEAWVAEIGPAGQLTAGQMPVGQMPVGQMTAGQTASATPTGTPAISGLAGSALLVSYEPEHTTAIRGGENGGRRLIEYRTVRDVTPLGTWDGGRQRLVLPNVAPGLGAAVLVQSADLKILGAANLPPG